MLLGRGIEETALGAGSASSCGQSASVEADAWHFRIGFTLREVCVLDAGFLKLLRSRGGSIGRSSVWQAIVAVVVAGGG